MKTDWLTAPDYNSASLREQEKKLGCAERVSIAVDFERGQPALTPLTFERFLPQLAEVSAQAETIRGCGEIRRG
jgi:hypothetical protein